MIEVLSKPAEQITAGDIQSLIESEVPEGEQIEFKETLPAKKGTVDPWMRGEGKIGDRAKSELLEEVVAFGNAYGGAFVLGVRESDAKPPGCRRNHAGAAMRGVGGTPEAGISRLCGSANSTDRDFRRAD